MECAVYDLLPGLLFHSICHGDKQIKAQKEVDLQAA
jgi:hypothetical protein